MRLEIHVELSQDRTRVGIEHRDGLLQRLRGPDTSGETRRCRDTTDDGRSCLLSGRRAHGIQYSARRGVEEDHAAPGLSARYRACRNLIRRGDHAVTYERYVSDRARRRLGLAGASRL